jgi:hypothetical protein
MVTGTFVTPATLVPITISIPCGYDKIELINVTDYIAHAATIVKAESYAFCPNGSAFVFTGSGANPNVMTGTILLTDGFTFVPDSGLVALGAPVVITAVTNATPAVISSASTVIAGDVVRIYGTTGMLEISGIDFTVTAVNAGVTQTLGFLPAAGFLAAATAGWIQKVPHDPRFYPRRRIITGISLAASAVIQLSVLHTFTVGQMVRIIVPAEFGMPEINNKLGMITAVASTLGTGTNSITVNIDSTAFTAFAFPTSAIAAAGITFPQVVPVGEAAINSLTYPYGNLLDAATINKSFTGVKIGTGILVASKTYAYIAYKGVTLSV